MDTCRASRVSSDSRRACAQLCKFTSFRALAAKQPARRRFNGPRVSKISVSSARRTFDARALDDTVANLRSSAVLSLLCTRGEKEEEKTRRGGIRNRGFSRGINSLAFDRGNFPRPARGREARAPFSRCTSARADGRRRRRRRTEDFAFAAVGPRDAAAAAAAAAIEHR